MLNLHISTTRLSRSSSTSTKSSSASTPSSASPITPSSVLSMPSIPKRFNPLTRSRGSDVTLASTDGFAEDMDDDNMAWGKPRSSRR